MLRQLVPRRLLARARPDAKAGSFVVPEPRVAGRPDRLQWFPDVRPVTNAPPAYDPQLSALLQSTCLVMEHVDPGCVIALAGPTLLGWFHCGSQLPWKTYINLTVHTTSAALSCETLLPLIKARFEAIHSNVTLRMSGSDSITINVPIEEQVAGRYWIDVHLTIVAGGAEQARARHRRALIDGGITSTWVPADIEETRRQIRAWYGDEKQADTSLPMPADWVFDTALNCFVRVAEIRRAVMWPPSGSTLKWAIVAAIVLCIVYLIGLNGLPSLGKTLDASARAAAAGPTSAGRLRGSSG